ncbi:hypothetical protein HPB49_003468 [Dermacentor silvarum]|uniref:Uncharacterized protein n=1 Tax=Dermacentor silvarum TaxID=543639 RepID=A0ACB8DN40_DERSI|nr:hypothetical protein HPB49_003468 [Dermacentor silvarum]
MTGIKELSRYLESAESYGLGNTGPFGVHEGAVPAGHMLLQFPAPVQLFFTDQFEAGNSQKSGGNGSLLVPGPTVSATDAPAPSKSHKPRPRRKPSTGKKRHGCNLCTKSFITARDLRTHLLKHQGHKPFHCHLCPATFLARGYLADHLQSHLTTKRCKCDLCPRSFMRPVQLNRHKERDHSNTT